MKKIIVLTLTFILMTTPFTVQLDAKETNYAPINPTAEQVEAAAATDLVVFEDANLEQGLSEQLGVPVGEITVADMETLSSLSMSYSNISDITGLEYATNLTSIHMYENEVADISPLSGLTNLEYINFEGNNISDISALSGLTNLRGLDFAYNTVSDISPLSGLTNLTSLGFYNNNISDISPLSGLTNLEYINFDLNNISDISPLSGLTNLVTLYLASNNISDISPLSGLTNLEILWLGHNNINDITPLTDLTNLIELDFAYNTISDISVLSGLTNITMLYMSGNDITDISPLSSLINLEYLEGSYNLYSDITPLSGLTNLSELYIAGNNITDISPLSGLTNLVYTDVSTQVILLSDITVTSNEEIFYNVTDINGVQQPVSLGIPQPGTFDMDGSWFIEEPSDDGFSYFGGFVFQNVTYEPSSTLTANTTATTTEETALSDSELISLFSVVNSEDEMITVDQTAVDYSTPGEYQVIFTDESGNKVIASLEITDVLPVIEVTNEELTFMLGSTVTDYITDFGATATEITAGDLTTVITVDDSSVNYSVTGTYSVVFTVVDAEGNEVSKEVSLVIERDPTTEVDPITPEVETNQAPVITADSTATTAEETELTDAELIALFAVTAEDEGVDISTSITVDQSAVDYSTPGTYTVVFTVEDEFGLQTVFEGQLTVEDILPVIAVTNEELTIMLGSTVIDYVADFGATATEITAGDLTTAITVDDSNVNYSVTGTYSVVFTVVDAEGNEVSKEVSLVIERDPTIEVDLITPEVETNQAPVITADSTATTAEETELSNAELIALFAVTAEDEGVDISTSITVDQSAVDYSTPGTYTVVFTVEDEFGLQTVFEGQLTVEDILPTLEVSDSEVYITSDATKEDLLELLDMSATEITSGDLTAAITIDDSEVEYGTAGTYMLYISVADEEGNTALQQVSVIITADDVIVDPVDPTDPIDPVDPVDPIDPVDPTDPVDPVDPTDPVDPIDPVDPTTDNNDDSNDDYVQMDKSEEENDNVLATTGSKSVIIFFIVSLVVFVGLKLSFKESKSAN